MDPRLAPAPVVATFAAAVRPVADVLGFYAAGSLASGDYSPAVSDLDLVAVIAHPLSHADRRRLLRLHRAVRRAVPSAAKLHCVYVPRDEAGDVHRPHLTWAHGELYRRPLSGIARAELLGGGITVYGPPPSTYLPAVDVAALQDAVRAELTGYWAGAVRRPWLWLQDLYVDLGLLTLARAEATLTEGRLIPKREALLRLHRFGVHPDLVREIGQRRQGRAVAVSTTHRVRRARTARRLVAAGIRDLVR